MILLEFVQCRYFDWHLDKLFCIAGKLIGLLSVADALKTDASDVVDGLNNMGIHVVMLTGDNEGTAKAIAEKVWARLWN